jgi:carboxylesterase
MDDMKLKSIHSTTSTTRKSLPILLKGGDNAVLILHGYNGHPHDVLTVAKKLNKEGFTVSVPRLPGHGTNASDFLQTSHNDWLRRAVDSYFDIKALYKKIHIIGFSMGGVLALYLASFYNVDKIAVICPALILKNKVIWFSRLTSLFVKRIKRKSTITPESENEEFMLAQYWSWHYPKMLSELMQIISKTKDRLKYILSDTLIIASRIDELVSFETADYILKNISSGKKKKEIYDESPHNCLRGPEKKEITNSIVHWLVEKE